MTELCIFCGNRLEIIEISPKHSGFRCNVCDLQWTIAEHKDNDNWAVRHTRLLEQRVQEQSERLVLLEQQLVEQSLIIDAIYAKLKELTT